MCGSRRHCSLSPSSSVLWFVVGTISTIYASLAVRKPFWGQKWIRAEPERTRSPRSKCCGVAVGVKFSFIIRLYICFSLVCVCVCVCSCCVCFFLLSFVQRQNNKMKFIKNYDVTQRPTVVLQMLFCWWKKNTCIELTWPPFGISDCEKKSNVTEK